MPLLGFAALLLPSHTCGQAAAAPQSQASKVTYAIGRIQRHEHLGGEDALYYVEFLADARAVGALPILEQYYARTPSAAIKAGVASALVSLGDKNEEYWVYLIGLATPVAESGVPNPFVSPLAATKAPTDIMSPEFKVWASSHKLTTTAAYLRFLMDLKDRLTPIARSGDPRGVPLLRKALLSSNTLIAGIGAMGLAQAQDKASIPLIVDACKRNSCGDALLFFDDPTAQSVFASYNPGVDIPKMRKFRGSPFGQLAKPQ